MVCSSRTSSWYRLAAAAASPSRVSSCSTAESACCLEEMTAVTYRVDSVSRLAMQTCMRVDQGLTKAGTKRQRAAALTEQAACCRVDSNLLPQQA